MAMSPPPPMNINTPNISQKTEPVTNPMMHGMMPSTMVGAAAPSKYAKRGSGSLQVQYGVNISFMTPNEIALK